MASGLNRCHGKFCVLDIFSSRRQHTIYWRDWSSDVCSSDLEHVELLERALVEQPLDALPSGQLALCVLGRDAPGAPALLGRLAALLELFDDVLHGRTPRTCG